MQKQSIRIIGGQYRGRKLSVLQQLGLRPSGDRIRETLFNWLAAVVPGSCCLDLFVGSGALSLEALSRGASHVVGLDCSPRVIDCLQHSIQSWRLPKGLELKVADSIAWLADHQNQSTFRSYFDVVFIDPPFSNQVWGLVLKQIEPYLKQGAWIYIESDRQFQGPGPDSHFKLWRSLEAGRVWSRLYAYQSAIQ